MKLNRLFPLLIPLAVYILDQIYFFYPKLIYVAAVLINLLIFFAVWQFCRSSQVDKEWWNYLILPAIMSTAVMAYSVFLSSKSFIQLLFFLNLAFLYFYLRYVYYYLLNPGAYEVFSIENISSYASWLSFFLISATIYGLESFLNLPIFRLALVMLAAAALIIYQIIWANKIEFKKGLPYILISCLILVELCWSISFLPFNYNISGLCLAICFYVIAGLIKNHLLDKLDASKVRIYLILGPVSLFLILFTARWL
ncbi:hypothetical protein HY797_02595 [Candidatus Falkowbacteria bacterium]|nr:hypothetical protein [Candidatus Falkowbacteria bacterium]